MALWAYVPNGTGWRPDIVLDLATQRAKPLWPDGYRGASLSHDPASAVLQRGRGASFERRWARRGYGNGD